MCVVGCCEIVCETDVHEIILNILFLVRQHEWDLEGIVAIQCRIIYKRTVNILFWMSNEKVTCEMIEKVCIHKQIT